MKSKGPKFDIFSGRPKECAIWLETVTGLQEALERVEQIAAEMPASYFIYSSSVVAEIERQPKPAHKSKTKGSSA